MGGCSVPLPCSCQSLGLLRKGSHLCQWDTLPFLLLRCQLLSHQAQSLQAQTERQCQVRCCLQEERGGSWSSFLGPNLSPPPMKGRGVGCQSQLLPSCDASSTSPGAGCGSGHGLAEPTRGLTAPSPMEWDASKVGMLPVRSASIKAGQDTGPGQGTGHLRDHLALGAGCHSHHLGAQWPQGQAGSQQSHKELRWQSKGYKHSP